MVAGRTHGPSKPFPSLLVRECSGVHVVLADKREADKVDSWQLARESRGADSRKMGDVPMADACQLASTDDSYVRHVAAFEEMMEDLGARQQLREDRSATWQEGEDRRGVVCTAVQKDVAADVAADVAHNPESKISKWLTPSRSFRGRFMTFLGEGGQCGGKRGGGRGEKKKEKEENNNGVQEKILDFEVKTKVNSKDGAQMGFRRTSSRSKLNLIAVGKYERKGKPKLNTESDMETVSLKDSEGKSDHTLDSDSEEDSNEKFESHLGSNSNLSDDKSDGKFDSNLEVVVDNNRVEGREEERERRESSKLVCEVDGNDLKSEEIEKENNNMVKNFGLGVESDIGSICDSQEDKMSVAKVDPNVDLNLDEIVEFEKGELKMGFNVDENVGEELGSKESSNLESGRDFEKVDAKESSEIDPKMGSKFGLEMVEFNSVSEIGAQKWGVSSMGESEWEREDALSLSEKQAISNLSTDSEQSLLGSRSATSAGSSENSENSINSINSRKMTVEICSNGKKKSSVSWSSSSGETTLTSDNSNLEDRKTVYTESKSSGEENEENSDGDSSNSSESSDKLGAVGNFPKEKPKERAGNDKKNHAKHSRKKNVSFDVSSILDDTKKTKSVDICDEDRIPIAALVDDDLPIAPIILLGENSVVENFPKVFFPDDVQGSDRMKKIKSRNIVRIKAAKVQRADDEEPARRQSRDSGSEDFGPADFQEGRQSPHVRDTYPSGAKLTRTTTMYGRRSVDIQSPLQKAENYFPEPLPPASPKLPPKSLPSVPRSPSGQRPPDRQLSAKSWATAQRIFHRLNSEPRQQWPTSVMMPTKQNSMPVVLQRNYSIPQKREFTREGPRERLREIERAAYREGQGEIERDSVSNGGGERQRDRARVFPNAMASRRISMSDSETSKIVEIGKPPKEKSRREGSSNRSCERAERRKESQKEELFNQILSETLPEMSGQIKVSNSKRTFNAIRKSAQNLVHKHSSHGVAEEGKAANAKPTLKSALRFGRKSSPAESLTHNVRFVEKVQG